MSQCNGSPGASRDLRNLGKYSLQQAEEAHGPSWRRVLPIAVPKSRRNLTRRHEDFIIFDEAQTSAQHSSNLCAGLALEQREICARNSPSGDTGTLTYRPSSRLILQASRFHHNAALKHRTGNVTIHDPMRRKTITPLEQSGNRTNSSETLGSRTVKPTRSKLNTSVHRNATGSLATQNRIPLKSSARITQPSTFTVDRPGLPTGKENICPSIDCGAPLNPNWPGESYTSSSRKCARATSAPRMLRRIPKTSMIRVIDTAKDKFDDTMLSCSQGLDASPNSTQEASMTANLNRIFGDARERPPAYKPMCLTGQLAALYEQPGLIQLHQRLEASLRFGALALPKGESPAARLQTDVAVRGQFLDLWTTAYKHSVLNAAIQAISRHGTADQRSPPSSEAHVRAHLESFLLNHEEAVQGHERKGALLATSSWERTMGKSLMIILLLDWARQAGFVGVPVFNQNSPFKSSWAVLLKLDSLVRPSWTNMKRTLAHLGYRLDHTQHSLAEFDFTIQNLAVDLRDGVRLTRLVELLLSDSSVGSASKNRPNLGQTTRLRIGKIEDMASPQTLTKALKYPLSGKAAKLHNVQIALDAMKEAACNPAFSEGITATDIVEGHREKTILLLRYLLHDKALSSFTDRPNLIDGGVLSKPQVDSNPDHISTKVPLLLKIQSGNVLPELQATLGGEKTWF